MKETGATVSGTWTDSVISLLSANDIKIAFLDTTSIDGEGLFRAKELKLDKFYYQHHKQDRKDRRTEKRDGHWLTKR